MASNVVTNSIISTFSAYVRRCLLLAVVSLLASVCFSQSRVEYIGFLKYLLDTTTKTAVLIGMKDRFYDGGENGVVIPDKVKGNDGKKYAVVALGDSCFLGCYNLRSVTVPSSVTSLGDRCFDFCSGLTEISLPNIKTLGKLCFSFCQKLTAISLPSATSLGNSCFSSCINLKSVDLPRAIYLGDGCFRSCKKLGYVSLSYTVTSIGKECFWNCRSLKQITIPHNVTYLGDMCFFSCDNLEKIVFQGKRPQSGASVHFLGFGRMVPCFVPQSYFQDYKDAWGKVYDIRSCRKEKLQKFFGTGK